MINKIAPSDVVMLMAVIVVVSAYIIISLQEGGKMNEKSTPWQLQRIEELAKERDELLRKLQEVERRLKELPRYDVTTIANRRDGGNYLDADDVLCALREVLGEVQ